MEKFRMLRKDGTGHPIPYSDVLAERSDMVECLISKSELASILGQKADVHQVSEVAVKPVFTKPGPGWVKNIRGHWKRKVVV